MISVQLLYRRPDGVTPGGVLITEGIVNIFSVRRYDTTGGEMTRVAFSAPIGDTVQLDPGTWGFELEDIPDGRGGILSGSDALQYRVVPSSGGPYQIDDLDEVNPDTGTTVSSSPEFAAAIADLQAQINALVLSGGGIPAAVDSVFTDATTYGKARLKDSDASAARTAAGVPAAANSTLTGTTSIVNLAVSGTTSFVDGSIAQADINGLVAALALLAPKNNAIFTGSMTVPDGALQIADITGLQEAINNASSTGAVHTTGNETVDGIKVFLLAPSVPPGSWSIDDTAGLQAALDNAMGNVGGIATAPYLLYPVNGSFPPRPNTNRHVFFMSATIQPTLDGNTAGGGGMVPGYDVLIKAF